jgi:YHS domain-containing protein
MKSVKITFLFVAAAMLSGCAASNPPASTSSNTGNATVAAAGSASKSGDCCAQCLVCKYNADLACVDVNVEKDTPSYLYNGTTYYFCSNACKKKFEKEPAKYISQK